MAKVQILNVRVLDNPASFLNPFQFEITFECIDDLVEDLEWKIIYVGSAESEKHDQTLDSVLVGPVSQGRHMFVFQVDPPKPDKIPENDALGVTVVLITCSYKNQEFIRVGYYINNEYDDPELKENPPSKIQFEKVIRNILVKPRVTKFTIDWDQSMDSENVPPPPSNVTTQQTMGGPSGINTTLEGKANELCGPLSADSNSSIPDYVQEMEH